MSKARPSCCGKRGWAAIFIASALVGSVRVMAFPPAASALFRDLMELNIARDEGQDTARWESYVTPHFIVLTDAGPGWSHSAGKRLERTLDAFESSFRGIDLEPVRPPERMVWVAFRDRHDYEHYARRIDNLDMSWSDGYYSTRTNRVALVCDAAPDSVRAEAMSRDAGDPAHPYPTEPPQPTRRASTTHEAVHQIAFNSGVQKRGVMYPLWLSEGLATNFEARDDGDDIGPNHDNPYRRQWLVTAHRTGALTPLHAFIALTRVPPGSAADTQRVYAQSWALFRFLYLHRPDQLRGYLEALAAEGAGWRSPAQMRAEFIAAFGDIASLERSWNAYLRLLKNPARHPATPGQLE